MKFTRKQFLTTLVTGLAGTALRPSALKAVVVPKPATKNFAALVGTSFVVRPPGREAFELTLEEIDNQRSSNGTTQFSLEFVAPSGQNIAEGTFDVDHPALGQFQMFLMPLGADANGRTQFRADFNLLDTSSQNSR